MKWVKYIAWDIHEPGFRIMTATMIGLAALSWTVIGVIGWVQIVRELMQK